MEIGRIIGYILIATVVLLIFLLSRIPVERKQRFNLSDEGKRINKILTIIFIVFGIIYMLYVLLKLLSLIGLFLNLGAVEGGASYPLLLIPALIWNKILLFIDKPIGKVIIQSVLLIPIIIILYIKYNKIKNMKEE